MEGVKDVQSGAVRSSAPACMVEGMSTREAARVFGLHRDTVRKMLEYSVPPGYRRQSPPRRPKLDPYHGVIDRILEEDRSLPRKQRHTAKRIYDRLRAEHGFGGKYTIVKDYVRERRRRTREMYVPLSHPPGDAQCDFGARYRDRSPAEQARDRETRHRRQLQVATSAAAAACVVCREPAVTSKHCDRHRKLNNEACRRRQRARRDAGLCRLCPEPAETLDYCAEHRAEHNARQRRAA